MEKHHMLVLTERWYPDTFGGSERVAWLQVQGLLEAGHQVTVFSSFYAVGMDRDEQASDQLRIIRGGREGDFPGAAMYSILRASRSALADLVASEQFDVVLCHHPLIGSVYLDISEHQIPFVYLFHSSRPQEIRLEGPRRQYPFNNWWTERMARLTAKRELSVLQASDVILYLSEFSHRILLGEYPTLASSFRYLQPGIDEREFEPEHDRDYLANRFFTVRRLTPRMGLDRLIDAAALLRDKGLAFRVDIAGRGQSMNALQQQIEDLELQEYVRLLGRITDEELLAQFAEATCFVLPTLDLEGLGIATLEALHSGLPAIGTPAGATPELLGLIDARLIANSTSAEDIAERMEWFCGLSTEEKRGLSTAASSIAQERFTAGAMNADLIDVLGEVIQSASQYSIASESVE